MPSIWRPVMNGKNAPNLRGTSLRSPAPGPSQSAIVPNDGKLMGWMIAAEGIDGSASMDGPLTTTDSIASPRPPRFLPSALLSLSPLLLFEVDPTHVSEDDEGGTRRQGGGCLIALAKWLRVCSWCHLPFYLLTSHHLPSSPQSRLINTYSMTDTQSHVPMTLDRHKVLYNTVQA